MIYVYSFLFAGYQIFLSGNYINFNLMLFSKYILLTILIIAFELFIIYLYEININKIICENKELTKKEYFKKFIILFAIFFGILKMKTAEKYRTNEFYRYAHYCLKMAELEDKVYDRDKQEDLQEFRRTSCSEHETSECSSSSTEQ